MQDYQIFISYKRDPDADVAEKIYNELESRGYSTFLDRIGLEGGSRFPERIASAIQSADLFVVLLSSATLDSEWVKKELKTAIKRAKDKTLFIVPIVVDCTPQGRFSDLLTKYVFNTFTIIESNGNDAELGQQLCNILESHGIYPQKDVADFINKNNLSFASVLSRQL